jgi:hypothetical protein
MTTPDLTFLRKLLGDNWVETEILVDNPVHLLGLWHKKDQTNPWVRYTEELAKVILMSVNIRYDPKILANKIKEQWISTLAEMESAVLLAQQGFAVTLEPTAPQKGPDLQADWEGVPYFVEVRAVGFSEEEDRVNSISKQVFAALSNVPSSYFVNLTVGDGYTPNSTDTNTAIATVIEVLELLEKEKPKNATLYYLPPDGKVLGLRGDVNCRETGSETQKRCREIVEKTDFIARFEDRGKQRTGTLASLTRKVKPIPEPDKTHERLKRILQKKRTQLPKNSRGIIALEVSQLFMLDDFSIESALYGDLLAEFRPVAGPNETIGDPSLRRRDNGFFRQTSRVSAIVIHKRGIQSGEVRCKTYVYPTNRANADTIRLSLAELRRFGDLGDREHLSAENVPE